MRWIDRRAAVIAALSLTGCVVGPPYNAPPTPTPPAFKETPPANFQESGWKTAQPIDNAIKGKWWEIFGDPQLNALEEQVAPENQSLKVTEARFREARALIQFNRAAQYPTITTAPGIASLRSSSDRPNFFGRSMATGDFVLPFDLNYELDLWGRVRRTVAAAREEAQASAADLQTATLSLQAELAFDYFELRAADAQQRLLDATVKAYDAALQLTINRFEGGVAPKADVAQARTQRDTVRVQATAIGVERAAFEHAIAVLTGKPPAALSLAQAPLGGQPPAIPGSLPSQLLERRPDIAALERRVAEANEQIGIARAAFYPTVTLGAAVGFEGNSITNWFNWPSRFWSVGPSMVQTLFDSGRRKASSEVTLAAYDATVASYRQTTLTAFQQVEDNLAALRILEQQAREQEEAIASARQSLELFNNRYKGGVDTYLQVITAQTVLLANQRNAVDILRRRMDSSVLLIKALGGGWNVSQLPKL